MDDHYRVQRTTYSPLTFDFLTGVFLILWVLRIVPDPYIIIDIACSLAASLLLRIKHHHDNESG